MIGGNQKWRGAAPILSKSAVRITRLGLSGKSIIEVALIRMMAEPRAWIKKYLSAASDEYRLDFDEIRGVKERRFSSKPSQLVNQEFAEIAIVVPSTRDIINATRLGRELRMGKSFTPAPGANTYS